MPLLSITLLGTFQVCLDGTPIAALPYDKARALLTYLSVEADQAHRRETLAGLLWPESPERAARQSLSQALSLLRGALGNGDATPPYLLSTRQTVQFNPESDYELDVTAFVRRLDACRAHEHARLAQCEPCLKHLERAVALYRGDLLAGFSIGDSPAFEEWARLQGEHLRLRALDALSRLAEGYLERGEPDTALAHARSQLALDPAREPAHRQVMRALAAGGQRSAALTQYETCRQVLLDEFGLEPDASTRALYAEIKDGDGSSSSLVGHTPVPEPPHNLPAQLTPFVGRAVELRELETRLRDPACRLLSLVGPGGSGKTRLALQVAQAQQASFLHGVYQVPLAGLQSPASILPAAANAVGLVLGEGRDPQEQLLSYLRQKEVLLILDNVEHLLGGVPLVLDILRTAPQVKIIITSRIRLNAQGEWLYPVAGLALSETPDDPDAAAESDAVRLFLASVQRIQPGFEPTRDDLGHALRICQLVRGMPLAILLAASWITLLSPAEIAAKLLDELSDSLDFMRADWSDVPARQRSLRAVCDGSWRLLTTRERTLFQALSAFRGGFSRKAAVHVSGASLHELRSLSGKCLIQLLDAGRYEIHAWMQQYATEKLSRDPVEHNAARDRHSVYYLAAVERWAEDLKGPRHVETLDKMDVELGNVRAAWDWAVERGHVAQLDRAAEGLGSYYSWRGRAKEGEEAFGAAAERLEGLASGSSRRVLLKVLAWQGNMSNDGKTCQQIAARCTALLEHPDLAGQDIRYEKALILHLGYTLSGREPDEARRLFRQSLLLFQDLGSRWWTARAMFRLGDDATDMSRYGEAEDWYRQGLEIARALGDPRTISVFLYFQSWVAFLQDQGERAERLARECLSIKRQLGDRASVANGLSILAVALLSAGKYSASELSVKKDLEIMEDLGRSPFFSLQVLGRALLHQGRYTEAQASLRDGLSAAEVVDLPLAKAACWLGLGMAALAVQDDECAQTCLSASLHLYQETGTRDKMSETYALLGVVPHRQEKTHEARERLCQALELNAGVGETSTRCHVIAACALFLAKRGHPARAVELYARVASRPSVAHSRWFEDVFGKPIAAAAAHLAPEVVQATRERASAQELKDTVRELLEEFMGNVIE